MKARKAWVDKFNSYKKSHPELADQLDRMQRRQLPDDWDRHLPSFPADAKGPATRASSGKVLNGLAQGIPWLIGGAADLAPSTKTNLTFDGAGTFSPQDPGATQLPLRRPRACHGRHRQRS